MSLSAFDHDYDPSIRPLDEVIQLAVLRARRAHQHQRLTAAGMVPVVAEQVGPGGAQFFVPLVVPEGVESGDGRVFKPGSLTMRDMPIPLLWQVSTSDGHDGSVLVGRVDSVDRLENGLGNAHGVFDTGPYGAEAERLVREGMLRWISADLDQFTANELANEEQEDGRIESTKMEIDGARLMAITLVPKPAFQECVIQLTSALPEEDTVPDGEYVETQPDNEDENVLAVVASGASTFTIPIHPPKSWFTDPGLRKPTALTVTDEGQVFGHIAAWDVDHIGMPFGTRPPRSASGYRYFHTGELRTADGDDVPVGQLTLAGGHAPISADAAAAVKHYDDTASAIADVHAGEDSYGIWVAGALRPGVTPEQIRAFRASAPSGDWRTIRGGLELVAVCQVNVPGFPIARAQVASGAVVALVAAGAIKEAVSLSESERTMLERRRSLAELRVAALRAHRKVALTAAASSAELRMLDVDGYVRSFETMPQSQREKLAKSGKALPDGSYPIESVADLKRAISAYGRAKNKAAARRHIAKRARQLGKPELIPDRWVLAMVDAYLGELSDARPTAWPIDTLADVKAAVNSYGRVAFADRPAARRHIVRRARALGHSDQLPSAWNELSMDDFALTYLDKRDTLISSLSPDNAAAVRRKRRKRSSGTRKACADESNDSDRAPELAIGDGGIKGKYNPKTQPRDAHGRFRKVLARLKMDLGSAEGMQRVVEKIEDAENLDDAGDYAQAAAAAADVIEIVDRIDMGGIDAESVVGIRRGAEALGSAIANLPLAFGDQVQKVRYSDLPPAIQDMIEGMITRVEEKIGVDDAQAPVELLKSFQSGGLTFSQMDISRELAKLLRLLT